MMRPKETFVVDQKYKKRFERWGAEKGYAILMAMFEYDATGEVELPPEYYDAFEPIKEDMDARREKYEEVCERNRQNGQNGGRPKKTEADIQKPSQAQKTQSVIEEPKKADIDIDNDIDINKEKINKKKVFRKPTLDEVIEYCAERKNMVVPQRFYDYYESNGWMVGKNRMRDWKAAVRTWERNFQPSGQRKVTPYIERQHDARQDNFGLEYLHEALN